MQKIKITLFQFCLLTLLILVSCQKDTGTTAVEGTVIDKTTGTPVPDAKVLIRKQSNDIIGGIGGSTVASVIADANGKFSLSFEMERRYNYEAKAIKDGFVDNGNNIAIISGSGKNSVQVPLQPYGYLKLHIKNVNPFNIDDRITLTDLLGGQYPNIRGANVDTIICCFRKEGNLNQSIVWWVERNGIDKSYNANIFLPAHDTTFFEINY